MDSKKNVKKTNSSLNVGTVNQVVTVSIAIEKYLKTNMEKVCSEMGLTIETAFNLFAKAVCRENRLPFEVTSDSF